MVYHGTTADVSRILLKTRGLGIHKLLWGKRHIIWIYLVQDFFSSAALWYICIHYDNAHNIQKDNNDSEAMERHHHDMELLCVCLLKPRTEILKKKTHGSGWNIKLPFSLQRRQNTPFWDGQWTCLNSHVLRGCTHGIRSQIQRL